MTEALKENPDILVLPELWDTAYDLTRLDEIADDEGQQAKQLISQFAKTNEVNIVAGSIAKKTEHGVTNTMYIFDRKGREVSQYSKLHLFKLMDEHLYLEAGTAKIFLHLNSLYAQELFVTIFVFQNGFACILAAEQKSYLLLLSGRLQDLPIGKHCSLAAQSKINAM